MSVELERKGAVGVITLNRPEKRNALNAAMWRALPEVFGQAGADAEIGAVVLAAHGDHFAAGADFGELELIAENPDAVQSFLDEMNAATSAIADCPKPVIGALKGACIGAGVALAAACDIRIADETARIALPPAQLGIAYPYADTKRICALIGPGAAKRLFVGAETITAADALRMGFVETLVDDGVDAEALAFAENAASLSGATHQAMLEMIDAIAGGVDEETPRMRALFTDSFRGEDFRAGMARAREQRAEARRRRSG